MLFRPEGLEWIRREDRECLLFTCKLPPIQVPNSKSSFILWLWLFSIIIAFSRVIDGALQTGYRAKLGIGSHSFKWHFTSASAYIEGEKYVTHWWMQAQRHHHRSWGLWLAGSRSGRCMTWGYLLASFWQWKGDGCFSWPPNKRHIKRGTLRLPPKNCGENRGQGVESI